MVETAAVAIPSISPEPWTAWFNYDKDGFICAAGVDTGPNREAGVCEIAVLCENVEIENKEEHNALVIADTHLIAVAPAMLRALKQCVAEWGKRDVFLLGPEKIALRDAVAVVALAEKRTTDVRAS